MSGSNKVSFKDYKITFRSPTSSHKFHSNEGITEELIKEIFSKEVEVHLDPRKLRKKIKLYYTTCFLTKHIRITILFQVFPEKKEVHIVNAFLGSFHYKNLFERLGLEGGIESEERA